jgi:phosphoenolpyruvate carboxylase
MVSVSQELVDSIQSDREGIELKQADVWRNEKEPYRIKVTYMLEKIQNTGNDAVPESLKYTSPEQFIQDLQIIDNSLRSHYANFVADNFVAKLIRQVELFGFHLATLDIRQHSKEHENAMAEILAKMGITSDYAALGEEEKIALLTSILNDPRPITSSYLDYSESTQECLNVYKVVAEAQKEFGRNCIQSYLISMSQAASDLLEVLVFAKEAACTAAKRTARSSARCNRYRCSRRSMTCMRHRKL